MRGKWAAGLLLLLWLVGGISVGLFVEKSEPDSLKESALAAAQWRLTEDYLSRVDRLRQGAGEIPCRDEGERTAEREALLWVLIRGDGRISMRKFPFRKRNSSRCARSTGR